MLTIFSKPNFRSQFSKLSLLSPNLSVLLPGRINAKFLLTSPFQCNYFGNRSFSMSYNVMNSSSSSLGEKRLDTDHKEEIDECDDIKNHGKNEDAEQDVVGDRKKEQKRKSQKVKLEDEQFKRLPLSKALLFETLSTTVLKKKNQKNFVPLLQSLIHSNSEQALVTLEFICSLFSLRKPFVEENAKIVTSVCLASVVSKEKFIVPSEIKERIKNEGADVILDVMMRSHIRNVNKLKKLNQSFPTLTTQTVRDMVFQLKSLRKANKQAKSLYDFLFQYFTHINDVKLFALIITNSTKKLDIKVVTFMEYFAVALYQSEIFNEGRISSKREILNYLFKQKNKQKPKSVDSESWVQRLFREKRPIREMIKEELEEENEEPAIPKENNI